MFARMLLTVAVLAGVLTTSADAAEPTTEEILARWAEASRQGPRLSPAVLRTRYGAVHSAHELEAASELLGAVDAKELQERFEWCVELQADGTTHLIGTPRDTVDQLFYSQLEITVDTSTGLPASIHFVASDGTPRPVAIQQRKARPGPMVLQVAAADSPSAPVIHTVAFVSPETEGTGAAEYDVDIEQLLRQWVRYRRVNGVRVVQHRTWIASGSERMTAHPQPTTVSPAAGYRSTVTQEMLTAVGGEPPAASSHVDSAESMVAFARLFEASAEQLLSLYDWKVVGAGAAVVVLEAKPRSNMGALDRFQFQLSIEPETGAGLSISVRDLRLYPELRPTPPGEIPAAAEATPIPARR
ncbi:hypothetical protein Mal4_31620 [Maioricimonas rarisocia]|uniref:Uncharacterized protein n=1 Tax=Maioricimonas rarisocia TaxID=2528026 RepID=A0A517Z8L7_9PLAN|nr:hypothetical protein [Maioricimonas rarisocia]QDU38832.1 hypothetical protein Mal4_31620 [Maioricimonas rarisocia]